MLVDVEDLLTGSAVTTIVSLSGIISSKLDVVVKMVFVGWSNVLDVIDNGMDDVDV